MIDNLTLQNFKAFQTLELDLTGLTLLSGWNSAGKSSVLQALAVLRQSNSSRVLEEGLLLNGDYVELGSGRDVLHEDYVGSSDTPLVEIAFTQDDYESNFAFAYDADSDFLATVAVGQIEGTWLESTPFQFLKADRQGPSSFYPKSYRAVEVEGSLGVRGEHAVNYLRLHQDDHIEERRQVEGESDSTLLGQTSAWLQYLSPGVNVDVEAVESTDSVILSYGYFGRAGLRSSNRYRATNVGFGLSYVLPIVVAALSAPGESLLLIENPEAHLHPRGQTAMGYLLAAAASSGVQIVVESHSDHFLNGLRRAVRDEKLSAANLTLHFFDRSPEGELVIESPEVAEDGSLSAWPEGFFDEWDRAITDLLT